MSARQEQPAEPRAAGHKRRIDQGVAPAAAAEEAWKRLKSAAAVPSTGKGASLLAAITAPLTARDGGVPPVTTARPSRPVRARRRQRTLIRVH